METQCGKGESFTEAAERRVLYSEGFQRRRNPRREKRQSRERERERRGVPASLSYKGRESIRLEDSSSDTLPLLL